jgi:hypothetical protein
MMHPVIDNPASCEIHTVICFLHAQNTSAAKIHRELFTAYGQKQQGCEADYSPPTSAEVKKMWIYTSTPIYAFMA